MSRTARMIFVAATLIIAIAIGIADVSGYLSEITIFVLVPVIAGSYFLGFRFGMLVAITAALTELVVHLQFESAGPHREIIFNTLSHSFIYILTAALIDRLVKQLRIITSLEQQRSEDLETARKIQESVFSPVPGRHGNLSIGSRIAFARELGGDYYYVRGFDDRLFFCIADITGKSIAAALFTSVLNESVMESLEHTRDLTTLLEQVNSHLFSTLPDEVFVTMFCALIDDEAGLTYANAGHIPPLLYSKRENGIKVLQSKSPLPIGVAADLRIESSIESFSYEDILLATTDGITESRTFREHPYEQLEKILYENTTARAQDIADVIFDKAVPEDLGPPSDDAIVMCVKRSTPS